MYFPGDEIIQANKREFQYSGEINRFMLAAEIGEEVTFFVSI